MAQRAAFDLNYHPASYFWPMAAQTHLVNRIAGSRRRASVADLLGSRSGHSGGIGSVYADRC